MHKIKLKNIEVFCSITGIILALIALLHSCRTDHKLKTIQYRANAPFFIIKSIQLDTVSVGSDRNGNPDYQYSDKPSELSGHLMYMNDWESQIPDNYPDNYPIGLLLENVGSKLRTFSVKNKGSLVFHISPYREGFYEIRHIYQKANVGKSINFTIEYETYEGFQGSNTWEIIIGKKIINRVSPSAI